MNQKAYLLLVILSVLSGLAAAQDTLYIKDEAGTAVPFAQVAIQDLNAKKTNYIQSNEQGMILIPNAIYSAEQRLIVQVSIDGFHQETDTISKGNSHSVRL